MPTSGGPKIYRNAGGGRFDDVTARAGLDSPTDKAMGVAVLELQRDGLADLFVGNDRVPPSSIGATATAALSTKAFRPASP